MKAMQDSPLAIHNKAELGERAITGGESTGIMNDGDVWSDPARGLGVEARTDLVDARRDGTGKEDRHLPANHAQAWHALACKAVWR